MTKNYPTTEQKENTISASEAPVSTPTPDAALSVETAMKLAREALQSAQASTQAAEDLRNWIAAVLLQLSEVARDAQHHLDHDETEIVRFALRFIAAVPQRIGIAPEGHHA